MAIGASARSRHLPFMGSDDPSLPDGMWVADVEVTGDASGGDMACNVILTEAGDIDESYWSLEQFAAQLDQVTGVLFVLKFANQRNYADAASPRTNTIAMGTSTGLQGTTGPTGRDQPPLPYFIGQGPAPATGVQLFIIFAATNTNTVALRIHFWGYRWGPRSLATPTGPQRPLRSPFGT